ncbi:MAG: TIM barrel protein [Chloroflexi bacterium]|nr:TIM barrel protein [Chloroflexota bacterium]MDA1272076.1 TIM barrel protein [Chloroflexota bacterium]
MIFGAITNSWREQLPLRSVKELVGEAVHRGAKHIELRQTCLGECEDGAGEDWRPNLAQLREVVEAYPDLTFDLAMALPCLTEKIDPHGDRFQAALAGAKLVGGEQPHLRVVDPSPIEPAWSSPSDIPEEALGLAGLATEAARQGVIMSMENSSLPIRSMAMLVEQVRGMVPEPTGLALGLCPDPTNQLRRFPGSDPLAELDALPLDMIKIVHFKQLRGGETYTSVDEGDLDCLRMRDILDAKGYIGAAIMEIPSDVAVFDNLEASFRYLES